jgi:hypothetical protein
VRVEHQHVGLPAAHLVERLGAVFRQAQLDAVAQAMRFLEQDRVDAVVFDIQHAAAPAPARVQARPRRRRDGRRVGEGRAVCCAIASSTTTRVPSPARLATSSRRHRLDQAARDDESEAGALDGRGLAAEPLEGLEQRSSCVGLRPEPVSSMLSARGLGRLSASTDQRTTPAGRLYFTALEAMFSSTWRRRCSSARTATPAGTWLSNCTPCSRAAVGRSCTITCDHMPSSGTSTSSSATRPSSTCCRSSTSLVIASRCSPARSTCSA